jgi:hypothetical protein
MKSITNFYRFISLQHPKSQNSSLSSYDTVTVAPLAKHLPAFYKTRREITISRGAFHMFLSGAKKTHSTSSTLYRVSQEERT